MSIFPAPDRHQPENVTVHRCPVCDQNTVTIIAELSTSMFFRCETCGFIWIEDKPAVPDIPEHRLDD
jgi:uncharacterized Zn finger protein